MEFNEINKTTFNFNEKDVDNLLDALIIVENIYIKMIANDCDNVGDPYYIYLTKEEIGNAIAVLRVLSRRESQKRGFEIFRD